MPLIQTLQPDWPASSRVRAYSTTRHGGQSSGCYASLNLGDHVGDEPVTVAANRRGLSQALELPSEPLWLRQIHGTQVVEADRARSGTSHEIQADGSVTSVPGTVCVVMTADCLPVLLCDRAGTRVAALHAGWRGLVAGVLEAGVAAMHCPPEQLMAWIGPAIGPTAFEVGDEVRAACVDHDPAAGSCFEASNQRWLADLPTLARQRLGSAGVGSVHGGRWCTWQDGERFFSYRRDGQTGRQASLIWLDRR